MMRASPIRSGLRYVADRARRTPTRTTGGIDAVTKHVHAAESAQSGEAWADATRIHADSGNQAVQIENVVADGRQILNTILREHLADR